MCGENYFDLYAINIVLCNMLYYYTIILYSILLYWLTKGKKVKVFRYKPEVAVGVPVG